MRRPDPLQPAVSGPSRPASDTGSAAARCARPAPGCAAGAAWRPAGRCARGGARSSPRTCPPFPAGPARPAQPHAARPARRCASPRRDDLARSGCPPARSRSRRYRRCARPAVVPPRIRPTPVRCLQVPARPEREPQKPRCRRPGTRWSSSAHRSSARRACLTVPGSIAPGQGQGGTVQLDRPREAAVLLLVGHDHLGRPGCGSLTGSCCRVQPPLGVPQPGLNSLELAAGQQRPGESRR